MIIEYLERTSLPFSGLVLRVLGRPAPPTIDHLGPRYLVFPIPLLLVISFSL